MLVVAVTGLLGGCGGDGGPEPQVATDDEVCRLYESLVEVGEEAESPAVFERSTDELEETYERRRAIVRDLIEVTTDEDLRAELIELDERRLVIEPVLLENLRSHRDELAEIGYAWDIAIFNSTVVDDDQRAAYHGSEAGPWGSRLAALCLAPNLVQQPSEDSAGGPEAGTIIFSRIDQEGLWAVPTAGGESHAVPPPEGWDDLRSPAVGPDGRTIVALASRREPPFQGIAVGTLSEGFSVIYEGADDRSLQCLTWDPRTGDVLASSFGFSQPTLLLRVDHLGEASIVDLPAPAHHCAVGLPDGRIVLSGADPDIRERGDVWVVDATGAGFDHLFGDEHCNEAIGGPDPSGAQVLVFQTCRDPHRSGLHVVDIDTGGSQQIVVGSVATPAWSPTGGWITFGYAPLGTDATDTVRVWLVRADGSGLRRLTDVASSYPVWVTDEV